MAGARLKLKMDVSYISFSAHTDYKQTSGFIRALRPPHVVLVHGEGKYSIVHQHRRYGDSLLKHSNTQPPI